MTVTILMLLVFAVKSGAAGRAAEQKSTRPRNPVPTRRSFRRIMRTGERHRAHRERVSSSTRTAPSSSTSRSWAARRHFGGPDTR